MARWREAEPVRVEPPDWYRTFHPEAWDAMDEQEQRMSGGCTGSRPWPADLHEWHSRRRWHEAQYAYRQDHPALAEQEMEDLINEELATRHGESPG